MIETFKTNSPAAILGFQDELIKTGKYLPLGRMKMISIAPNAKCPTLPSWDPIMRKWGRLMQLREMVLPLGQSMDHSQILVLAPLVNRATGRVELPPLGDPDFVPAPFTDEEKFGKVMKDATGKEYRMPVERPREKDTPRLIPQDLRDRAEGFLEGTNFYVFSPVLSISFQPEVNNELLGTFWAVNCSYNPADQTHPTLLIDAKTGKTHFFGGLYDVVRAIGEN